MTEPDDLTLTLGGTAISGWTEIRVTRGIERCPNDFDIALTDLFPGDAGKIVVQAGDACTVHLGADLVITGYVDAVESELDDGAHSIHVSGRGSCQDIVDCSAERPTGAKPLGSTNSAALRVPTARAPSLAVKVTLVGPVPTGWLRSLVTRNFPAEAAVSRS